VLVLAVEISTSLGFGSSDAVLEEGGFVALIDVSLVVHGQWDRLVVDYFVFEMFEFEHFSFDVVETHLINVAYL
jgi:hypothetical protein